jgi:hypothetical protein
MTQNVRPFPVGGNPLNYYSPDRIPFEAMQRKNITELTNPDFNDLIKHIQKQRSAQNKNNISDSTIREKLLQHTRKKGMEDSEGAGFWGDVWGGIKKLGSSAVEGVGKLLSNPDTIMSAVGALAPLVI